MLAATDIRSCERVSLVHCARYLVSTSIEQKVFFDINMSAANNGDYSSLLNGVDKDLGNIKLETDAKELQDVVVTADKPLLTLGIDRKIFNVEKFYIKKIFL